MVWDFIPGSPMVTAVVIALIGVGFWTAGLVIANHLWNHYRGDDAGE